MERILNQSTLGKRNNLALVAPQNKENLGWQKDSADWERKARKDVVEKIDNRPISWLIAKTSLGMTSNQEQRGIPFLFHFPPIPQNSQLLELCHILYTVWVRDSSVVDSTHNYQSQYCFPVTSGLSFK